MKSEEPLQNGDVGVWPPAPTATEPPPAAAARTASNWSRSLLAIAYALTAFSVLLVVAIISGKIHDAGVNMLDDNYPITFCFVAPALVGLIFASGARRAGIRPLWRAVNAMSLTCCFLLAVVAGQLILKSGMAYSIEYVKGGAVILVMVTAGMVVEWLIHLVISSARGERQTSS